MDELARGEENRSRLREVPTFTPRVSPTTRPPHQAFAQARGHESLYWIVDRYVGEVAAREPAAEARFEATRCTGFPAPAPCYGAACGDRPTLAPKPCRAPCNIRGWCPCRHRSRRNAIEQPGCV